MVPHHEIAALRHLVWQVDIALSQGSLRQVGLLQGDVVDIDRPVLFDVDPVSGGADDALDQDLVVIIEGETVRKLR